MNISDENLIKYCDGTLNAEQTERILEATQLDPELARRIQSIEASRLPYQEAFSQHSTPPIPDSLINRVNDMIETSKADQQSAATAETFKRPAKVPRLNRPSWKFSAIAASLAVFFVLGHGTAIRYSNSNPDNQTLSAVQSTQSDWVQRVADYQTLYVENTVANIVTGENETSSLLGRIERNSNLRIELPDLSKHGYTFVRAQELGYKGEPLVQLVYYKPGVAPLALCFMPSSDEKSSDVHISSHEGLRTADWIHNSQRFVIVGEESSETMQRIYEVASESWI